MPIPSLSDLLRLKVDSGGSDFHFTTNSPPRIRIHGELKPCEVLPLLGPARNFAEFMRETTRADYCDGTTSSGKSTASTATGPKVGGRIATYHFWAEPVRRGNIGTNPHIARQ